MIYLNLTLSKFDLTLLENALTAVDTVSAVSSVSSVHNINLNVQPHLLLASDFSSKLLLMYI